MSEESGLVAKVKAAYPFPWRAVMHPNGLIQIADAENKEVSLLAMTEFVCFITGVMNKKGEGA